MKRLIANFTEGYFKEIVVIECDQMYADGYTAGVSTGASYYGAGGCSAYVVDDNGRDEMNEYETVKEIERMNARLAQMKEI